MKEIDGPYYEILTDLDLGDILRIVNYKLKAPDMGLAACGLEGIFAPKMSDEEVSRYLRKKGKSKRDNFGKKKILDIINLKGSECNLQIYECRGRILLPAFWYDDSYGDVQRFFDELYEINWAAKLRGEQSLDEYKVGIVKETVEEKFLFWKKKKVKIEIENWKDIKF